VTGGTRINDSGKPPSLVKASLWQMPHA